MDTNNDLNPVLYKEIEKIEDPVTKEICQLAVKAAKDAMERGQSQIDEFISKQIDNQLPRIMRGS